MVTVAEFAAELVGSVIELGEIFVRDVALQDPLSFVSFLVGASFVAGASVVLGWLALGALAREVGLLSPTPSVPPERRAE